MQFEIEPAYLSFIYTDSVYTLGVPQLIGEESAAIEVVEDSVVQDKKEVVVKTTPTIPALPKKTIEEKSSKVAVSCMLLFDSEEEDLAVADKQFCAQIMKACGLGPDDYACVNFREITIHDVKGQYDFSKLVVFGKEIPKLELSKYTCTQVNTTQIIYADPLWMIQNNKELKSFLWSQLQLMFGIKK